MNKDLTIIKNNNFKTNTLSIVFKSDLKNIEEKNILFKYLLLVSNKYKRISIKNKKQEDLSIIKSDLHFKKYGDMLLISFNYSYLNYKYTKRSDTLVLEMIKDTILNPLIVDGSFDQQLIEVIKTRLKEQIKKEKENKLEYSIKDLFLSIDKEKPESINLFGDIKRLDEIKGKDIYNVYQDFIKKLDFHIFIVGDLDNSFQKSYEEVFSHLKSVSHLNYNLNLINESKAKNIIKKDNYEQNVFLALYRYSNLTLYERKYVLPLYSLILGGSSGSLLFKKVREVNSLCYVIGSFFEITYNYLLIYTTTVKKNVKLVNSLIKEVKEEMTNISLKDLKRAQAIIIDNLEMIPSEPEKLINNELLYLLGLSDRYQDKKKEFLKVSIKDIQDLNKKIILNTTYERGKI